MSSTTETSNAPFQELTANNHGPVVIVTAYIFLISSVLAVVVKIWTRLSTTRRLASTDYTIIAGTIFAIAQTIVLTIAVNRGLGRHIDDISPTDLESMSKAFYASQILLIAALTGAKSSITLLIISIKPSRPVLYACYAVLALTLLWCIASVFALAFQCALPTPWVLGPETCIDQFALQLGIGVVNIVTDVAIVILPFFMMQNVQVATAKRWMVSSLFALRIATPAFTVLTLLTYDTYYHSSPQDRPWHAVAPSIWNAVMLATSTITACIPSIKRFLADIQSGLMGVNISEPYELTHSGGKYVSGTEYGTGASKFGRSAGGGFASKVATRLGVSTSSSQGGRSAGGSEGRSRGEKDPRSRSRNDIERGVGLGTGAGMGMGVPGLEGRRRAEIDGRGDRETSESVKGLTVGDDVIVQTIDYKVEYEDLGGEAGSEGGGSSRSGGGGYGGGGGFGGRGMGAQPGSDGHGGLAHGGLREMRYDLGVGR